MRLFDCGPNKCRTASKEKIPYLGAFRGQRPATGQRTNDIPKPECEISEAEQALVADSLGHEYRDPRSKGRSNTRRFRGQDSYRRAQQIPREMRHYFTLRHN